VVADGKRALQFGKLRALKGGSRLHGGERRVDGGAEMHVGLAVRPIDAFLE